MANNLKLKAYTADLINALETLTNYCQNCETATDIENGNTQQLLVPSEAPAEVHCARKSVMTNISRLQRLLTEPLDFLQDIAKQNQLLACINWLGEFQVLACIPLQGSVPFKDVAELVGVPERQLCRIVRMTATAGFLHEPSSAHVAHTALSASFVTRPSHLDALMFIAETAAPAALHMAAATKKFGQSIQPQESPFNVALGTSVSFASICEQNSKPRRQWLAYLRHILGYSDLDVADNLTSFDWFDQGDQGDTTVVEVNAHSTATALRLVGLYPELHFIVQMRKPPPATSPADESSLQLPSRITVEQRNPGTLQNVKGAAVYILRLPSSSPALTSQSLRNHIIAELNAHLGVLRTSAGSRLILTTRLLPEFGVVEPEIAATACLRDLTLHQLANQHEMEVEEFSSIVNSVTDGCGRLVLVKKPETWNDATIAFEIQYQDYAD